MSGKNRVGICGIIFALIFILEAASLNFLVVDSGIFNAVMVVIGLLIIVLIWQIQYLW